MSWWRSLSAYPPAWPSGFMLRTGFRVSGALLLRRSDLRLNQHPRVISILPEASGKKARRGRELTIPVDPVESLADLASFHSNRGTVTGPCATSAASGSRKG